MLSPSLSPGPPSPCCAPHAAPGGALEGGVDERRLSGGPLSGGLTVGGLAGGLGGGLGSLIDGAALDPDPPRIREAGTAAEGTAAWALALSNHPVVEADAAMDAVAAPARGVVVGSLPTGSGGLSAASYQTVALAALERDDLRRLELIERPDGALVLSVDFVDEPSQEY